MTTMPQMPSIALPSNPNVRKMRSNTWLEYSMDKSSEWVQELLLELNEHAAEMEKSQKLETSHLNLDIRLKKCSKDSVGDYLLCEVKVDALFNTLCVKTGATMTDTLNFEVKICFLASEYEEQEEFKDQTEHFTDGHIYELYYLNKNWEAPLQDAIHEQLFLNLDYYPSLENH
jgi:hypothetical protein